MPGNKTINRSPHHFFPVVWTKQNIAQGTNGIIRCAFQIEIVPLPVRSSVVSMTAKLSAPLTAGDLNLRITDNGTPIGGGTNVMMVPADGTSKTKRFKPGKVVVGKNRELGVNWNADGAMLPTGSVDVVVYFEVQPE